MKKVWQLCYIVKFCWIILSLKCNFQTHLVFWMMWHGTVRWDRIGLMSNWNMVCAKLRAMSGLMLKRVRLNSCTATESMSRRSPAERTPNTMFCSSIGFRRRVGSDLLAGTLQSIMNHSKTYRQKNTIIRGGKNTGNMKIWWKNTVKLGILAES